MRKSPAQESLLVVALLGLLLSGPSAYSQNPAKENPAQAHIVPLGPYHALVIGINNYQHYEKLRTPVNDAKALARLLQEQYGFNEPKLLLNGDATRKQIFAALIEYQEKLPVDSNLVIFFAGHGLHDSQTDAAYWLPVDAEPDNRDRWISANDITSNIRVILSKHVLVISDSCYSGALTRETNVAIDPLKRGAFLAKMLRPKSRNLIASGGDEPVADGGAAGHSVFANAVLKGLTEMEDDQFTAAALFYGFIQRAVMGNSDQVPQYDTIPRSGDEHGDFVFSRGHKDLVVKDANPPRTFYSGALPEIACERELPPQSIGPKISEGATADCKFLDQPLRWLEVYSLPELPAGVETKSTVMLTLTVDENGRVIDVKPRGGKIPQGLESALKASAQPWKTNRPTYKGKRVKSSFALNIDFGQ